MAVFLGEALCLAGSMYVYLIRMHARFHTRRRVRMSGKEARLIIGESGKLGMQELAMSAAMFVFTMYVTRLGTDALAYQ